MKAFSIAILVAGLSALGACPPVTAQDLGPAWERHTIDRSSQGADGVRLADANGDGLLDIVTGWEEGGVVRIYLNPGPSRASETWPALTVGQVSSVEDAVFVDLDGDGALDVVSSAEGTTRTVHAHWAPADRSRYVDPSAWRTEPFPATTAVRQWMFCLPTQVDGQHGIDLILGSKGPDAQLGWLEAPSQPRDLAAWRWHPLRKAGWIMSRVNHDIDGDGDLDLVVSDRMGPRRGAFWLENPGALHAKDQPWKEHALGAEDQEVMFLTVADVDDDGLTDILAATKSHTLFGWRRLDEARVAWEPF